MICTINDIADVISESIPNPAESEYSVFVGLEHYDPGEVRITRFGSTDKLVTAVKVFKEGDILLARRNVYLKRAGLVDFSGVTSGDSIVLRVKPDLSKLGIDRSLIHRYLPFVLNTEEFWNYAEKYSDGTMSKRLSPKILLQYQFEIPDDIEEKNRLLWGAFSTKESYRQLLQATDEMVYSQFLTMLEKSDRKNTLGDFVKRRTPKRCGDRDLPILSVTKENSIVFQEERFESTVVSRDRSNYVVVPRGYIVQGIHIDEGNFGLQNLVDEGIVSPAYKLWEIVSTDVVPELLEFYLRSPKAIDYYSKNFLGTTVVRRQVIKTEDLLAMPTNFPSLPKQQAFWGLKVQADKSKIELKNAIEKVDRVIRSLMQ